MTRPPPGSRRPLLLLGVALLLAGCEQPFDLELRHLIRAPGPPASLTISPALSFLETNGLQTQQQLIATLRDGRGAVLKLPEVTWESSHAGVTVDAGGLVRAVQANLMRPDTVRIVARAEGLVDTATVVVYPPFALHTDLPGRIVAGKQRPVRASVQILFFRGGYHPTDAAAWSSSDTTVVTVSSDGVLHARRTGTATVTATFLQRTASRQVNVVAHGYRVTDLGTLGGEQTVPYAINDAEDVVGQSQTLEGRAIAFLWRDGRMHDLGSLGAGSTARGIDNAGQVVGGSWATTHLTTRRAARWTDGEMEVIAEELFPDGGMAQAVSKGGRIAIDCSTLCFLRSPIIWHEGEIVTLRSLPSYATPNGAVRGVNDHGAAVGTLRDHTDLFAAVIWRDGTPTALMVSRTAAWANAVNDRGQVVGYVELHAGGALGVLWSDGNEHNLGHLGGGETSAADLNESTAVVGWSLNVQRQRRGFVWHEGVLSTLSDLVHGEEWVITDATSTNDGGSIVGVARNAATGRQHAVILTPERP
jgi:probable HAF family extracellular repeat protein